MSVKNNDVVSLITNEMITFNTDANTTLIVDTIDVYEYINVANGHINVAVGDLNMENGNINVENGNINVENGNIAVNGTITNRINVDTVSGTTVIQDDQSASFYTLSNGAYTVTLPVPMQGLDYTFVLGNDLSGAANVTLHTSNSEANLYGTVTFVGNLESAYVANTAVVGGYLAHNNVNVVNNNLLLVGNRQISLHAGAFYYDHIKCTCVDGANWLVNGTVRTANIASVTVA